VGGLLAAITVHALAMTAVSFMGSSGSAIPMLVAVIGTPLLLAGLMGLTWMSLTHQSRTVARELSEEAALGIIPEHHLRILPFHLKRMGSSWLPPNVERRRYIPLATRLALRKYQRSRIPETAVGNYSEEIVRLRADIRRILGR
jgi:hypothetical protein